MKRLGRNRRGNQIAEFGPAIFILFVMLLIPMMVLVYVGLGFACGWYLNFMCVRSCAVVKKYDMFNAINMQTAAWYNSGLPKFTGASVLSNVPTRVETISTNTTGGQTLNVTRGFVRVTTVVSIKPFVSIPMVPMGPFVFTYNGERPVEDFSDELENI